mmetsp:Transcript_25458/g.44293  ORF Transcript_25458/g.44293 Transcript_25458/m.44293 type:complete len:157 (-) Transcript_25458:1881-2351(-)
MNFSFEALRYPNRQLVPDRWSPTGWSWQEGPSKPTMRHRELYRSPGVDNRVDERHKNLTPDRWKPSGWNYVKSSRVRSYKNIIDVNAAHLPRDLQKCDYKTSYQTQFTPPPQPSKRPTPAKSSANLLSGDSPFKTFAVMKRHYSGPRKLVKSSNLL